MNVLRSLCACVATALLCGCGQLILLSEVDRESFVAAEHHQRLIDEPRITWMIRDDYEAVCGRITGIVAGPIHKLMGCAHWNPRSGTCTIVMGSYYSPVYLGHEVRHCFEGAFH